MKRSAISFVCAAMMVAAPVSALAASSAKPLPAGPSAGIQRAGETAGRLHHVPIFRQGSGVIMDTITSTTTTTTTTSTSTIP